MGQSKFAARASTALHALLRNVRLFSRNERGNIATVVALAMVPMAGVLALAGEVSGWWAIGRAAQNAADSAVIAAANNNDSSTFIYEARKVAATMNFPVNPYTSVSAFELVQGNCPGNLNPCYKVTISKSIPLYLTRVVGYRGTNGTGRQTIFASAIAGVKHTVSTYCFFSLATSGNGITVNGNGGGGATLNGCNIASLSNIKCPNGAPNSMQAGIVSAAGNISGNYCSSNPNNQYSNDSNPPADSFGGLAIPTGSCTYSGNTTWSANVNFSAATSPIVVCGNLTISGNIQITTGNPGTVLVIRNGSLNFATNSSSLTMDSTQRPDSAGLTIIFTGTSGTHTPPTNGTLNFFAPTSGTYKWIAMYQDPAVTSNVSFSASGSSPTWDITGLLYFPNADVTWSGNLNKATNGANCFALVAHTITLNGSVNLSENQSGCPVQDLFNLPHNNDTPIVALAG